MKIQYHPIGIIHSPFHELEGMPIQPSGAANIQGQVEIFSDYVEGLKDLDGFSHLILIYHFHRARQAQLTVTPFLDSQPHGVFATRAPVRPNPIGLSIVRLLSVDHHILHIENVDILDGTPLLDIKPYVPAFDQQPAGRSGWLRTSQVKAGQQKSDSRFQ